MEHFLGQMAPKEAPTSPLSQLSQLVAAVEHDLADHENTLAQLRATFLVNWGPNGRSGHLVKTDDDLLPMLLSVLQPYEQIRQAAASLSEFLKSDAGSDGCPDIDDCNSSEYKQRMQELTAALQKMQVTP